MTAKKTAKKTTSKATRKPAATAAKAKAPASKPPVAPAESTPEPEEPKKAKPSDAPAQQDLKSRCAAALSIDASQIVGCREVEPGIASVVWCDDTQTHRQRLSLR